MSVLISRRNCCCLLLLFLGGFKYVEGGSRLAHESPNFDITRDTLARIRADLSSSLVEAPRLSDRSHPLSEKLSSRKKIVVDAELTKTGGASLFLSHMESGLFWKTRDADIDIGHGRRIPNRLVLKYQWDCEEVPDPHPMVAEFVYMKLINELRGIAPAAIALSEPSVAVPGSEKFNQVNCYIGDNPDPRVRFIVQQQVGRSLDQVVLDDSIVNKPRMILRSILRGIELLNLLHSMGIIHGDIHPGNLALRSSMSVPSAHKMDLILIDFGRTRFFIDEPESFARPLDVEVLLTPWELNGQPKGPRDDLLRMVLMVSLLRGNMGKQEIRAFVALKKHLMTQDPHTWPAQLGGFFLPGNAEFEHLLSLVVSLGPKDIPKYTGAGGVIAAMLQFMRSFAVVDAEADLFNMDNLFEEEDFDRRVPTVHHRLGFDATRQELAKLVDHLPLVNAPVISAQDPFPTEKLSLKQRVVIDGRLASTPDAVLHLGHLETGLIWKTRPAAISIGHGRQIPNQLVVKYQWDCGYSEDSPHPLIAEFVYMKLINEFRGIAPAALALSKPTDANTSDAPVKFAKGECMAEDHDGHHPQVRFIVQQQVGRSLDRVLTECRDQDRPRLVLRAILRGLEMLNLLHNMGLVHGDVHPGNLALRSPDSVASTHKIDLVFIDFGRTEFFVDNESFSKEGDNAGLLSPWEIAHRPKGPRDDFLRMLFMIQLALDIPNFRQFNLDFVALKTALIGEPLESWPARFARFFFVDSGPDPLSGFPVTQRAPVVAAFEHMFGFVVNLGPKDLPQYTGPEGALTAMVKVLFAASEEEAAAEADDDFAENLFAD